LTQQPTNKITFSGIIILVVILSCIGIAFLSNGVYLLCCLITLYIILFVLWKSNRPGIIVFGFLSQWFQVVAYVLWMNNNDWNIDFLTKHADIAVAEACIGLTIMTFIISRGIKNIAIPTTKEFFEQAKLINEKKIFLSYLGSTFFLGSIGFAFGQTSGFAQIILTLSSVKWIFFLVYGYVAWINKKNRTVLFLMILFEFGTSLYSYFSSFKEVILMAIILSLTFVKTINFRQFFYAFLVIIILGAILLTWTSIKGNYRTFLSKGKRQQTVDVSRGEAFDKMYDEISTITWKDYQKAINLFLYRLQYIFHLSKTMDRIPEIMPHEYGQLWWENITYVVKPRIFFPDKPIFEATKKTNKYTAMGYSGAKQGSSFSLGYFADSYIDFGYIGMFMPLSLIALFVVFIYRKIFKFYKLNILIRYSLINVALFDFTSFEADGLFLFGRLLLMFLVTWFLCKVVMPPLQRWLYK
jgi:hypothetical protein